MEKRDLNLVGKAKDLSPLSEPVKITRTASSGGVLKPRQLSGKTPPLEVAYIISKASRKVLACLVFIFYLAHPALASDTLRTIRLENDFLVLGKNGEVGVWQAPQQANDTLGIGDVTYAPADFFKPWRHERFQFGYAKNPRWLRLDLTDTFDRRLILELNDPHLDEVRFFQVLENEPMDTVVVGSRLPFGERKHHNFQFEIEVPANDTVRCYLNIPLNYSQLDFNIFLWDAASRAKADRNETLILVVFFSLIFIYLLLLGLAINLTRFGYFWFYFFYVLLVGAFIFADLGLGFRHVWSDFPYVQQVSKPVLANAYLVAGVLFVLAHFNARRSYPLPDQTLRLAIYVAAGLMVAALALPFLPAQVAHVFSYLNSALYITTCMLFFWLIFLAIARRDRRFPGWLLAAFSLHGLHVIYVSLERFNLFREASLSSVLAEHDLLLTFHTPLALMLGMLVEMAVILGIGVRRFKKMYAENRRNARELAHQKRQSLNALVHGMEVEQQRIARELHDGLGGGLSAVKFKLERLRESQNGGALLGEAIQELAALHQDLRDISHNLMPKPLYKLGLLSAVEQLVQRMQTADVRLKIHFFNNADLDGISELSKIYLFRIVQELLNNLFRHAHATEAWLQFIRHEDNLLISLEDNGKGFEPQAKANGGIGLSNVRYRVEEALGGKVLIESSQGRGTLISVEIPLKSLEESAASG